jgi:hypothetical protein
MASILPTDGVRSHTTGTLGTSHRSYGFSGNSRTRSNSLGGSETAGVVDGTELVFSWVGYEDVCEAGGVVGADEFEDDGV